MISAACAWRNAAVSASFNASDQTLAAKEKERREILLQTVEALLEGETAEETMERQRLHVEGHCERCERAITGDCVTGEYGEKYHRSCMSAEWLAEME